MRTGGRRPSITRGLGVVLALGLLSTGAACGSDDSQTPAEDQTPAKDPAFATPRTSDSIAGEPAWYIDDTLYVGDQQIQLPGVREFSVAAHTVVYTSDDGLCFTDLTQHACMANEPDSVVISADGERVGFIDFAGDVVDEFNTPLASTNVVDLTTGRTLLRSTAEMGDIETDDLAALYPEVEPGFRGFTADGEAVSYGPETPTWGHWPSSAKASHRARTPRSSSRSPRAWVPD